MELVHFGLRDKLQEKQQTLGNLTVMKIQVDQATPYGLVLQVLDITSNTGIHTVDGI